jgi:metal-responsive CopG/Arc/MetJ family transcriptional regulator
MAKSVRIVKKRGRPPTGQDRVSAIRLPYALTVEIDRWGEKHNATSRSDAIRRLVELGLSVRAMASPTDQAAVAIAK